MLATLPLHDNDHREWLVSVADQLTDGRLKLFVTACLARLLHNEQDFFRRASYIALAVEGERQNHVVAFARSLGKRMTVVAVGRLFMSLYEGERLPVGPETWGDTSIRLPKDAAASEFTDVLSGHGVKAAKCADGYVLSVAETLSRLPIAVLVADV